MRVLVFFDLPVETKEQRRTYTKFRKFLLRNGFMMLQESVYCKLALNSTAVNAIVEQVHKTAPWKIGAAADCNRKAVCQNGFNCRHSKK